MKHSKQTTARIATILIALLSVTQGVNANTTGPNGESATPSKTVAVPQSATAKLKGKNYTAAMVWHESSEFVDAVTAGATDEFARFGIDVSAVTSSNWDSAKRKSDVETVMAKKPNIILTLPFDPPSAAEAFKSARDSGTKLVFLSVTPEGFTYNKDYAAIVTDDLFQMGKQAADAMAKALNGKGEIAWIYHDANFYVTNQRDNAFKATIEKDHPGISIIAEEGLADPARAEDIANALLLRHPNLDGIYAPWTGPAEGVLAALRASGNKKTKIVTLDLSDPLALDMLKNGNVAALVADQAYELGRAMAAAGILSLLGDSVPPFVVAPAVTINPDNIRQGYQDSQNRQPPKIILDAL